VPCNNKPKLLFLSLLIKKKRIHQIMSGYYEMKGKLGCWEDWFDSVNKSTNDYVMDRNYWMRPNVTQCQENSLGTLCTFSGPKTVPRTTQESFLQGRGQILNSNCPDCEVIYLPESLFPSTNTRKNERCQDMALLPEFTRQPKSCGTLSETEITTYAFMPGAWQKGYTGYNSMCDTNIQSREVARLDYRAKPRSPQEKMTNYGSYNSWVGGM
jgi:hypothetical protein